MMQGKGYRATTEETEELLIARRMFLISFQLKAVSFISCALSTLNWKGKYFVLPFKIRKLSKNGYWVSANCFKRVKTTENAHQ